MKKLSILKSAWIALVLPFVLTGCYITEDPGPVQEMEKDYAIFDFDRLEVGDAMNVTVEQGDIFSVNIKGDRRNLDDLAVDKVGNTLRVRFVDDRNHNRQHDTYVTITMPSFAGAVFSGAVRATVVGFDNEGAVDLTLSGASTTQFQVHATSLQLRISGASDLYLSGAAKSLTAQVSGASKLRGYELAAEDADVEASGASMIRVNASNSLHAVATGASDVFYKGNAAVNASASGASRVLNDN